MIYLDSAATTLQKPPAVARASYTAIRCMASPGRGGHRPAMRAAETAFACRTAAAELFHVPEPEQVVFTFNATHGLNIAIHSLVKPGSRVVISGYEHNAVTRPLNGIPDVTVSVARSPLFDRDAAVKAFAQKLEQGADVVICTHVSNVFGFVMPVHEISQLCAERRVPLIIDASQSAGCIPVDFSALGASFVAMPGHKGLYGPQGTGILLCKEGAHPLLRGGTGSESLRQEMPEFLPDRLEAGTHNIAGLAGLLEGLRYVRRRGVEQIERHEQRLIRELGRGLAALPGLSVYRADSPDAQAGVLSFYAAKTDCESLGEMLGDRGFALRAGLHCAPLAHETAGTLECGTIRASVSDFNREYEIHYFLAAMEQLLKRI